MKNVRLLLPLIEVMKIVRSTSPIPDMPSLSSPTPRLKRGKRRAYLSINQKSLYFFLCFVADFSSPFFFFPSFPNCSSPRKSALVFAKYPRFHFFVSQPKTLRNKAKGYLCENTCLEKERERSKLTQKY